jgi:hypothetical protein
MEVQLAIYQVRENKGSNEMPLYKSTKRAVNYQPFNYMNNYQMA